VGQFSMENPGQFRVEINSYGVPEAEYRRLFPEP
jgi:hypothetical protein